MSLGCTHPTIAISSRYVDDEPPGHYTARARCVDCLEVLADETHEFSNQTARDLAALAARRVTQEAG